MHQSTSPNTLSEGNLTAAEFPSNYTPAMEISASRKCNQLPSRFTAIATPLSNSTFAKVPSAPFGALRKVQSRSPACGSSLFRLYRACRNEGFHSCCDEPRLQPFCLLPCCNDDGLISFWLACLLLPLRDRVAISGCAPSARAVVRSCLLICIAKLSCNEQSHFD